MESGGVLTKLGNCQEASPYFPLSTRQTAPNSSAKYKRNYRSLIVGGYFSGQMQKNAAVKFEKWGIAAPLIPALGKNY